jgi:hypothetical protein
MTNMRPALCKLFALLLAASVRAQIPPGGAPIARPEDVAAALSGGTILFNARLRYESGDQSNLKDSNAITLGTRFGFETARIDGIQGLIEGGNTTVLSPGNDYNAGGINPGGAGRVAFPDEPVTYLNQAWLSYDRFDTLLKVGRQRLNLDNTRFVGDVSWWQKMQTYDSVTAAVALLPKLDFFYGYVWHVDRIYGNEAPQPDWRSKSHLLNLSDSAWKYGTVTIYAYLLDFTNSPANSSNTYGGSFVGAVPVAGNLKLTYRAEAASQSGADTNPVSYTAHYFHYSMGGSLERFELSADYEILGSDAGRKGFSTPLATLHAFDGWVNEFLSIPADGLHDFFIAGTVPLPKATPLKVVYHKFESDFGGQDYGHEWDAMITHKIGAHWTLLAEAGRYHRGSASGYFDTNKYWLQTEFSY